MPANINTPIILRQEDLLHLENTLYEPKKEELVLRQFVHVKTDTPAWAQTSGFRWYDAKGSAIILSSGGSAKDLPVVGEGGGLVTYPIKSLGNKIKIDAQEIIASQSVLNQQVDARRSAFARRYIAELENKLGFIGDAEHKIQGLLNHDGITVENIAATGSGGTAALQRLWSNKTAAQIVDDILTGKKAVEKNNIFKSRVLIVDTNAYFRLMKPFSDVDSTTILSWLQDENVFFEKIITTNAVGAANNGFGVNSFVICDNDPEVMELELPEDLTMGNPQYDILGNAEIAVWERTGGLFLRHPSAVYIGKGN